MGSLLGENRWHSFAGYRVGYERKALETGISLHGSSAGLPEVDSSTWDFEG